MAKFTRVTLSNELRADTDGMPVFRKCFPHETLLSFYDDSGNEAFNDWWNEIGNELFGEWFEDNKEIYK